jgi:hypothetical protein
MQLVGQPFGPILSRRLPGFTQSRRHAARDRVCSVMAPRHDLPQLGAGKSRVDHFLASNGQQQKCAAKPGDTP